MSSTYLSSAPSIDKILRILRNNHWQLFPRAPDAISLATPLHLPTTVGIQPLSQPFHNFTLPYPLTIQHYICLQWIYIFISNLFTIGTSALGRILPDSGNTHKGAKEFFCNIVTKIV